jgi:hypothetical protein
MKAPHVEIQDFDNDGWPDVSASVVKFADGKPHPVIFRHRGLKDGLPQFRDDAWAVNDFPTAEDRAIRRSGTLFEKMIKDRKVTYTAPGPSGDFDNDGRNDLYVSSYIDKPVNERDFLFRNEGGRFVDVIPELVAKRGATHGIQWVDFDGDGDLDFSLANNNPNGTHSLYRNLLPAAQAARSVQVTVLDTKGRATRPGAEVRVYAAGSRTVLGMGIVDSGGGYCSQNVMPVHVGLGAAGRVDIEVTAIIGGKRAVSRMNGVNPATAPGVPLVVR